MFGMGPGQPFERRLEAGALLGTHGVVVAEAEPQEVRIEARRGIGIVPVEREQLLLQADGFPDGRRRVGRLDLPRQERGKRSEDRSVRRQDEGVLRARRGLLAGVVEDEGFPDDEVVERGAIRVGNAAFLQKILVRLDRGRLQEGRRRKRPRVVAVDLLVEAREIPGREVVSHRFGGLGAVQEAPPIALEVVPVPLGQNGFQDRVRGRRQIRQCRRQEPDLLGRVAPLDLRLERDPLDDGANGFRVSTASESGVRE